MALQILSVSVCAFGSEKTMPDWYPGLVVGSQRRSAVAAVMMLLSFFLLQSWPGKVFSAVQGEESLVRFCKWHAFTFL